MKNISIALLISIVVALISSASAAQCFLCSSASQLPVRWDYTFSNGKKCRDYYVALSKVQIGSSTCTNGRSLARAACCNAATPSRPSATTSTGSSTGTYNGPRGNEPVCNICRTTEYPGLPSAMMIIRYVGGFTCSEFYHRGRNGMIPDYMCGPTQDFAQTVCGCGVYNPRCRANPRNCFGASTSGGSSYSLTSTQRASSYSSTPGVRNLRGGEESQEGSSEVEIETFVLPDSEERELVKINNEIDENLVEDVVTDSDVQA